MINKNVIMDVLGEHFLYLLSVSTQYLQMISGSKNTHSIGFESVDFPWRWSGLSHLYRVLISGPALTLLTCDNNMRSLATRHWVYIVQTLVEWRSKFIPKGGLLQYFISMNLASEKHLGLISIYRIRTFTHLVIIIQTT